MLFFLSPQWGKGGNVGPAIASPEYMAPLPETLLRSTFEEPGLFNSELALMNTLPISGRLFSPG